MKGKTIFIGPAIEEFMANPDALSQQITIFKNGGRVNEREAIPYVPAERRNRMLEFGTNPQPITSNGVKREYIMRNKSIMYPSKAEEWEQIVEQMAEEIADLRNANPA